MSKIALLVPIMTTTFNSKGRDFAFNNSLTKSVNALNDYTTEIKFIDGTSELIPLPVDKIVDKMNESTGNFLDTLA